MLILGRRANQSIVFPSCGITVRILEVNGNVTKVGIEAPRSVEVLRGELVGAANAANPEKDSYHSSSDHARSDEKILQFSQRIAELKASLHTFQQLRARNQETKADEVLAELLEELARLDRDCLEQNKQSEHERPRFSSKMVSEPSQDYHVSTFANRAKQILVVNAPGVGGYFAIPSGTFHGCQLIAVNNLDVVHRSLQSNEPFDYIVCNCGSASDVDIEVAKAVRSKDAYRNSRLFVACETDRLLEKVKHANHLGIDAVLSSPLDPTDLWNHMEESEQIDA